MPYGSEGNRRSVVIDFSDLSTNGLNSLVMEMHLLYHTPDWVKTD